MALAQDYLEVVQTCQYCKFNKDGFCKRFPPTPIKSTVTPNHYDSISPKIEDDDYCGEFKL